MSESLGFVPTEHIQTEMLRMTLVTHLTSKLYRELKRSPPVSPVECREAIIDSYGCQWQSRVDVTGRREFLVKGYDYQAAVRLLLDKTNATPASDVSSLVTPRLSSFPFLRLPPELQLAVFIEAVPKPGVHWVNMKAVFHDNGTRWSFKFVPIVKYLDDSLYRYSSEMATTCPLAARAISCISGGDPALQVGIRRQPIDVHNDLVCVKVSNSIHSGIFWHQDSQSNPRYPTSPTIRYDAVTDTLKGYEKLGLFCQTDFVYGTPFQCSNCMPSHYNVCPKEISGWIDCCPDIKEFYLVLNRKMWWASRPATAVKEWCVKYEAANKSLTTYRGHLKSYYEIHDPRPKDGSQNYGCPCPLNPACHTAPVESRSTFDLLAEIRSYLLNNDHRTQWKLSRQQRESIRFKVLLQGR